MKVSKINSINSQQNQNSFGMKLVIKDSALKAYKLKLPKNVDAQDVIDKFTKTFEDVTKDINPNYKAIIDLDETTFFSPEIMVDTGEKVLRTKKYSGWIFTNQLLPEATDSSPLEYAMKRTVGTLHRVMAENGYGFAKQNPFDTLFKQLLKAE